MPALLLVELKNLAGDALASPADLALMNRFDRGCTVRVRPFTRQFDGAEVVIGLPEQGIFLALPSEAVELLDLLASGTSVGEVEALYTAEHAEVPDLEDLLSYLEGKGFVSPANKVTGDVESPVSSRVSPPAMRYHFSGFPEGLARVIFSRFSLTVSAGLIILASILCIIYPSILASLPGLKAEPGATSIVLFLMTFSLLTTFFHEMAHLVAARSRGVACRLGIGNRLWILVAETDMTGIWSIPKGRRYLPILAGPLLDMVSAAVLVLVLFAQSRSWFHLPSLVQQFLRAGLFVYGLRISWQCFFFLRTDFYYVYTTAFDCKNLMKDVEDYWKWQLGRWLRRPSGIDQSHIPAREMRAIRRYAPFWLVGRVLAFFLLFTVTLPLCFRYIATIAANLFHFRSADPRAVADSVGVTLIAFLFTMTGLWIWLQSLVRARRVHGLPDRSAS